MMKLSPFAPYNQRDSHTDVCLLARHTLDGEGSTHLHGAFTHGTQPKMPRERLCGIKSSSVIMYFKEDLLFLYDQSEGDDTGARVLDNIVQCFLRDAVERLFRLKQEIRFFLQIELDDQLVACAQNGYLSAESRHQSLCLQRLRAKLKDERA